MKSELKKEEVEYKNFRSLHTNWGKPSKGMVVENKAYIKRIFLLKDKIDRINIKIQNINKALKNKKYKICFGSKRLLFYRHKIQKEETKYNTYRKRKKKTMESLSKESI